MRYEIFRNKNCFITGATGGIGRQIALKMADNKCNLFLTGATPSKIACLQNELELIHDREIEIHGEAGDLNSVPDIERLVSSSRNRLKAIDIFIHCVLSFLGFIVFSILSLISASLRFLSLNTTKVFQAEERTNTSFLSFVISKDLIDAA